MKLAMLAVAAAALGGCASSVTTPQFPFGLSAQNCPASTDTLTGHVFFLRLVRAGEVIYHDQFETGLNLKKPFRAETVRPRSYVSQVESEYRDGRISQSSQVLGSASERVAIEVLPRLGGYQYSAEIDVVDHYRQIGAEGSLIERPIHFGMQLSGESDFGKMVRATDSSSAPSAYEALFNQAPEPAEQDIYTLEILGCGQYKNATAQDDAPHLTETLITPRRH